MRTFTVRRESKRIIGVHIIGTVRRCKLTLDLKAPSFQKFHCETDNSAFNLNLVFLSLHSYS